jgi:hypothetical protein
LLVSLCWVQKMPRKPERKRPSFEPNKAYAKWLREQSGRSVVDFASCCGCGESTWRKMEAGERVDAETLRVVAEKLKLPHWHDLLSESERKLFGNEAASRYHFAQLPLPSNLPSRSPFKSYLFQLPAVVADFTGREAQIKELAHRLSQNADTIARSAFRGMGGIGKTCLAIRVAHEVTGMFPDAQLFLELRGTADGVNDRPVAPVASMGQIIRAFHPDAIRLPEDEKELAGIYRGVLAGKRALIILDNAASANQLRPLLSVPPPVGFLITSRNSLALEGVETIPLEALSPDEAYSFLRRIMGPRGTHHELLEISELCCRLPLALRVAADFLRLKNDWPVARYIAALESERLRWLKIGDDPDKDVEAVLKLSSAQRVRDSVEQGFRWHLLHIFEGDFDLRAAASVWDADEKDHGVLDDLSDMTNRSLILYDQATRRYRLHDLMRPIAEGLFA